MVARFGVETDNFKELRDIANLDRIARIGLVRAVNRVADKTRTRVAGRIQDQIALPAARLRPSAKQLYVRQRATSQNIQSVIQARGRPTSLARFARGSAVGKKKSIAVEVKPGYARYLRKAFFLKLPAGKTLTETKHNLALAIRLKEGEKIQNKKHMVPFGKGLYLLYGPSIQQLAEDNSGDGEFKRQTPIVLDELESEILRLIDIGLNR